jgi:hypothetical protein
MAHLEAQETPKMESEHHSKRFLMKAARLASKKHGKKMRNKTRK